MERERNGSSVRTEFLIIILWTVVLPFQAVHFCVVVFKIFVREECTGCPSKLGAGFRILYLCICIYLCVSLHTPRGWSSYMNGVHFLPGPTHLNALCAVAQHEPEEW